MTGQVLMEVADLSEPYFFEVELPEKREGHLDEYVAKQGLTGPDSKLDVTYILATDPDEPLNAVLMLDSIVDACRCQRRARRGSQDEGHPRARESQELQPRPGAKVIAKVYCGRRSSGFVFFHEIYEWCCKFFF